jgi:crotonobetaine/carnitine-CoA ligase
VVIGLPSLREQLAQVIGATGRPIPLSTSGPQEIENIWRPASGLVLPLGISRPAAILYTSGTTGKPKGCMLDNTYLQESAAYNTRLPEQLAYGIGSERMMNPLPLYHINAMVNTLGCAIITGSCYVMPGRFSATNWWNDLIDTRATRFKYLGIMIPALLAQPETARDRDIGIKYAFGAGVDPTLHERFEARFGIRLMEVWGMTETGRAFMVDGEPRYIDTRACGRPRQGLEARIVNEAGEELPDGEVGELVVRHNARNPRYGFFSGYLHDPEATEAAWEGGWFHTGDLCRRSADGMYFFVDRKKNIIRRSGENISSAEVESVLAACPLVRQAVVMAVPDALRDEEVLACVVPAQGAEAGLALASSIHAFAAEQLAYYKTPGWIKFLDELPLTGTQKVQKHRIFPGGFSPDSSELHDLRGSKRWQK